MQTSITPSLFTSLLFHAVQLFASANAAQCRVNFFFVGILKYFIGMVTQLTLSIKLGLESHSPCQKPRHFCQFSALPLYLQISLAIRAASVILCLSTRKRAILLACANTLILHTFCLNPRISFLLNILEPKNSIKMQKRRTNIEQPWRTEEPTILRSLIFFLYNNICESPFVRQAYFFMTNRSNIFMLHYCKNKLMRDLIESFF